MTKCVSKLSYVIVLCVLLLPARSAVAQPTQRAISGVVRDSLTPIANAVVVLEPNGASRAVRTDAQGRFRFDNVGTGRRELRTVWIGYQPDERIVEVPESGLDLIITLVRLPFQLDTMRVVGRLGGMLGTTVAHSDLRALGGTEVQILGTPFRTRTAPDGRFQFPDVRPGGYVLRAARTGFASAIIPVRVPSDSAVEVAVFLDTLTSADRRLEGLYVDMKMRVDRRSVPNSVIVPSQELAARKRQTLDLALRDSPSFLLMGLIILNQECVFVNGQLVRGKRLQDYFADDVKMVEIYGSGGDEARFAKAQEFTNLYGPPDCGFWAKMQIKDISDPSRAIKGAVKWEVPPRPGLVHMVYIWLKPQDGFVGGKCASQGVCGTSLPTIQASGGKKCLTPWNLNVRCAVGFSPP